jgi:hypothetical protein
MASTPEPPTTTSASTTLSEDEDSNSSEVDLRVLQSVVTCGTSFESLNETVMISFALTVDVASNKSFDELQADDNLMYVLTKLGSAITEAPEDKVNVTLSSVRRLASGRRAQSQSVQAEYSVISPSSGASVLKAKLENELTAEAIDVHLQEIVSSTEGLDMMLTCTSAPTGVSIEVMNPTPAPPASNETETPMPPSDDSDDSAAAMAVPAFAAAMVFSMASLI